MRNKRAGAGLAATVMGLLAVVALASPAAALKSGKANAVDGSVSSGTAHAENGSVASGAAVAKDGSVSSGCATAIDDSTASGGVCPPKKEHKAKDRHKDKVVHRDKAHHKHLPTARAAAPTRVSKLAFTGPAEVAPMAAAGAVCLALGAALVSAGRRRATTPLS